MSWTTYYAQKLAAMTDAELVAACKADLEYLAQTHSYDNRVRTRLGWEECERRHKPELYLRARDEAQAEKCRQEEANRKTAEALERTRP